MRRMARGRGRGAGKKCAGAPHETICGWNRLILVSREIFSVLPIGWVWEMRLVGERMGNNNDEEDWDCRVCSREVMDGQMGLECAVCEGWHHCDCMEVSKKDYNYYSQSDVMWICKECRAHV